MPNPVDIPPDRFVTLDGVRFHYLDWGGDGDPMLLLAGLGCTAHVFAELAPHLSGRFRVLALTRRGHGLTDQVQGGHALADAAEGDELVRGYFDGIRHRVTVPPPVRSWTALGAGLRLGTRSPARTDRVERQPTRARQNCGML